MDEQQTMPCKATGRPKQALAGKLRPALPVLALFALLVLTGCDASAQNLTGAMKADAEARRVAAQAPLVRAEAERIAAQAVADTQREQMRQLDEANRRYAQAQDARVRDMQMLMIVGGMFVLAGVVAGIGLHYATKPYPQMQMQPQPYQQAPQVIERVERQIIFINPADLPQRNGRVLWGGCWVPREQLESYAQRCTGREVQVWQGQ